MSVFKAYDIRGLAYSELDSKFAEKLGRALATHLDAKTVAVASDIRESGPELHEAFLKGLNSSGADVLDLGITTTGVLYRATVDLPVDASVVITASHNPPEYNGFKICNGTLPMAGKELQELKDTFDNNIFKQGNGSIKKMPDFENEYLRIIVENAGVPKRKMKIAIDCGNAVPGPLTIKLMEKLGVELIPVHCDWNNKFPNHPGVYVIMRKVLPKDGYRYKGIETIESPLILYVGKTTAKRSIKARLVDHFGGLKPNYQSSQFRKFIYQVCQDDEAVKNIVWSENTLIATVSIEEPDEVIDCVEKLAMQVFRPRFNIKDR